MKQETKVGRLFKVLVAGVAGVQSASGSAFNAKTAEKIVIPQHTTWGAF